MEVDKDREENGEEDEEDEEQNLSHNYGKKGTSVKHLVHSIVYINVMYCAIK